jgi:hypothetical protein
MVLADEKGGVMTLPNEPHGFAVNLKSGVVHKRYAPDAVGLRRTTAIGVENMLIDPKLCEVCFPQPKPVRSQTRFSPKPVKLVEPPETRPEKETPLASRAAVEPAVPSAEELYADNLKAEEDGKD